MTDNHMITTIYDNWKGYQENVAAAIAPLTAEQLALQAAPHLHSIGEIVRHIIWARIGWFIFTLNEDKASIQDLSHFVEEPLPTFTAAQLVHGLGATWRMISDALARWSDDDLKQTFPDTDEEGTEFQVSRAWVIYHLLEHDLHHGGEVSLTLGMHGLQAQDM